MQWHAEDLELPGRAAIGKKRDRAPIGRPARLHVCVAAKRKLARAPAAGGHQPQIAVLLFCAAVNALQHIHHMFAIWRKHAIGKQLKPVQVRSSDELF